MGDEGWLKRSKAEYRKFVYLSDALRITGKVTKKYVDEEGEHCVDIETHGVNQRDEDAMPGSATIALPVKNESNEKWPLFKRLNN